MTETSISHWVTRCMDSGCITKRLTELQVAQKLSPDNDVIYAQLARAYAQLQDREETLHYVQLAEQSTPAEPSLTATGCKSRGESSTRFHGTGFELAGRPEGRHGAL